MKDYLIIRNFMNDDLLKLTEIDDPNILYVDGKTGLYGQELLIDVFIKKELQNKYKYLIFIDEDCLLTDKTYINHLIKLMDDCGFDICGVPDGGMVDTRIHRPDVPNIFFTIIKTDKIINKLSKDIIDKYEVPILKSETKGTKYDNFEPYYKTLCYFIYELGMKFLPINAENSDDNITTIIKHNDVPVICHTWYARKFNKNKDHTDRILEQLNRIKKQQ